MRSQPIFKQSHFFFLAQFLDATMHLLCNEIATSVHFHGGDDALRQEDGSTPAAPCKFDSREMVMNRLNECCNYPSEAVNAYRRMFQKSRNSLVVGIISFPSRGRSVRQCSHCAAGGYKFFALQQSRFPWSRSDFRFFNNSHTKDLGSFSTFVVMDYVYVVFAIFRRSHYFDVVTFLEIMTRPLTVHGTT